MFDDFSDFTAVDDSSGEALGEGLDSSAVDLSGDSLDWSFGEPLQGSSLELGGDWSAARVFDGGDTSLDEQYNLSGASDAAFSDTWDSGEWDTNGAGSGLSVHPATVTSHDSVSTWLSGVAKFGASIGQLFASGGADSRSVIANAPANVNPNRSAVSGVSTSNALLLVVVVVAVGAMVALGGNN